MESRALEKRPALCSYVEHSADYFKVFTNRTDREQAEEARNKAIEYRKGQSGNIYSFELVFGPAKGEETSKPKLIYRDKGQANYESAK